MHGSKGLKELFEFRLRPGPRDLSHKHLDGVGVGLVQVFQRPGHLDAVAIAAGQKEKRLRLQGNDKTNENTGKQNGGFNLIPSTPALPSGSLLIRFGHYLFSAITL